MCLARENRLRGNHAVATWRCGFRPARECGRRLEVGVVVESLGVIGYWGEDLFLAHVCELEIRGQPGIVVFDEIGAQDGRAICGTGQAQ